MLRRILLAVLALCLALPSAAPAAVQPHGDHPLAMAQHQGHAAQPASSHDQGQHSGKHNCIGCAAALDGNALLEMRVAVRSAPPLAPMVAALPQARAGPDTPPPRV